MKKLISGLAIAMLILHQDFWLWDNTSLVFGFIPVGLAYHAAFSIAAAVLAVLAIRLVWPHDLVAWATQKEDTVQAKLKDNQYTIR